MTEVELALKAALSNRYAIESQIGEGGMAVVFRARDVKHDRLVALKVLRSDVALGVGVQRFLDEIRIAAQLSHPHIVPLHDSGEAEGWLYYVMPYIAGESLRARLDREGPLAESEALGIVREIADALAYAHKLGVVHRDIKPENILLLEGHALLADFGIARAINAADTTRLTGTGLAIGTPGYMSPEQIAGEKDVDGRADIYSLACVLYEMLSGEAPFAAPNAASSMAARFHAKVPTLEGHATVSQTVARALARAMAVDPAARFATASEFIEALVGSGPRVLPARKSVVVLPFTNLSAEAENEYFSDGLTDEVISDLSKVKSLHVISRTTARAFKGRNETIPSIARRLGVRYALEGSVRKAGSNVRINAQLIDTAQDAEIWSAKYAGTFDDIFNLQERVSREIVHALDLTLTADEDRRLASRPITDARAYDCYLRARQEMQRGSAESIARTESLLEAGLKLAPGNPLLEAAAVQLEIWRAKAAGYDETIMRRAEEQARRLAAAHPTLGEAQYICGAIALERGDPRTAAGFLKKAVDLDPFPEWKLWLGFCYASGGQITETKLIGEQLVEADPLSFTSWGQLAAGYVFNGEFEAALAPARQQAALEPRSVLARWFLTYVLALNGRLEEMRAEVGSLSEVDRVSPYTRQAVALLDALSGNNEKARAELRSVGEMVLDAHLRFHFAESWTAAGEHARGLTELEQAVRGFHPTEFIAKHGPFFAPLRGHAEFDHIVATSERLTRDFAMSVGLPARAPTSTEA